MTTKRRRLLLPLLLLAAACAPPASTPALAGEQEGFWLALRGLCGRAFAGTETEAPPGDTAFKGKALVMHVRQCGANEVRIPFHVGENRSRTWVVSRTAEGLRLKHDHRHEDGKPDSVTWYGGDTRGAGTTERQEFHADLLTAALIPAAVTNVWTMEVVPGTRFTYALRREGTNRRFRIDFDLTRPVRPPPPPWGHARAFTPAPWRPTETHRATSVTRPRS